MSGRLVSYATTAKSAPIKDNGGSIVTYNSNTSNPAFNTIDFNLVAMPVYTSEAQRVRLPLPLRASDATVNLTKFTWVCVNAGEFAKQRPQQYVARSLTTKLAGISNSVIKFGYSGSYKSVNFIESVYTYRIAVSGGVSATTGLPINTVTNALDSFGRDDAARQGRGLQAELQYNQGTGSDPKRTRYAALT
jgi:hypothetical protein